jgi:3-deoxy-D-manno-octulosonic-acid transferase
MLAEGLLGRLVARGQRVHVSTGTPAGLDLLMRKLPLWDAGRGLISGGGFPLDDNEGLRPFFRRPPGAFLALETELWPGLLRALEQRGIPRLVVNGRLTDRSLKRGGRLLRRAASRLSLVATRDEESLAAFLQLGAPKVQLGGNLKADLPPPRPLPPCWNTLRSAWSPFPVVVAGNTVEGEESAILDAWRAVQNGSPGLRLMLAPRQPRRFEAVAALLLDAGIPFQRASQSWPSAAFWGRVQILLLDTLGDLAAAYAEGTVALVGGGWGATGGHNPLEPARAGVPTLLGPGYANFEDLVPPLAEAGLVRVVSLAELRGELATVLAKAPLRPRQPSALPEPLTGALERTMNLITPYLP